jgi:CreA protein
MTSQAASPYDTKWLPLVLFLLAWVLWPGSALAADEPDLIFRRSTVFKWISPNDKLATYGVDDPEVEGVACHFTVPEKGGFKGWLGLAEEVSDIPLQGQDGAGRRYVSAAALAVLQEDANRPWLRRQAERAGLYGLFGQTDRGFAEEFNFLGAHHALGSRRCPGAEMWRIRPVTGI